MTDDAFSDDRYFTRLAAAFVRGTLGLDAGVSDGDAVERGVAAGLRLHKFKRAAELPRVRKVIGALRGWRPDRLLDVGSGRGTFLWPLLDALPDTEVIAIDRAPRRARDIGAVAAGGVARLAALRMDARSLALPDDAVDVVTLLEVLEHMERPERAAAEAVRVARRAVIATAPSKPDDNPEHIHLFTGDSLQRLLVAGGALRVRIDYVHNHVIAIASL